MLNSLELQTVRNTLVAYLTFNLLIWIHSLFVNSLNVTVPKIESITMQKARDYTSLEFDIL